MPQRDPPFTGRRSIRMPGFDYATAGAYFVTICAAGGRLAFGRIAEATMIPSPLGALVAEEWHRSAAMRKELRMDAFVLMPNHIHGIVWIGGSTLAERTWGARTRPGGTRPRSLSSFVQGYKAAVTSRASAGHVWRGTPIWQRGYYDHMIRSERTLHVIRRYVAMNPGLWSRDAENPYR